MTASIEVLVGILFLLLAWKFVRILVVPKIYLPKLRTTYTYEERQAFSTAPKEVDPEMRLQSQYKSKINCYNPKTCEIIGTVAVHTPSDVENIVANARVAQNNWKHSTFIQRRAVLSTLLEFYTNKENIEQIVKICCLDSGKTELDAVLGEVIPTAEKLRYIISQGEKILSPQRRNGFFETGLMGIHKSACVEYHPLGVLAVIAPFNYPGHNLMNHVISGIFSGNAVVIKVSEHTAFSADFLLRPVKEAVASAGFHPDVVQVVTGLAETGKALVGSKHVDKIVFTGSDTVGKIIMKQASETLTPVVLELGGKDAFVICTDVLATPASRTWVLNTLMRGVFQNAGQNCIGVERVFIEDGPNFDVFTTELEDAVKGLRLGVDVGAMTLPLGDKRIETLVSEAVKMGARLVCGGKKAAREGNYFEPTMLVGVTQQMRIFQDEVFGPVLSVIKWGDENDMLRQVNGTKYGLCSSVFCLDKNRANRINTAIEAGMGNINDFGINYLCQSLPFGGIKQSGFGCFAGPEGLRACCRQKSVTRDRFPGIRTSIPAPYVYPVNADAGDVASSMVQFIFGFKLEAFISFIKGIL